MPGVLDTVYDDPENQNRWKPANYDEDFKGEVLVRTALALGAGRLFVPPAPSGHQKESPYDRLA